MLKRLFFVVVLLSPAAAWFLYKPVRVLAPRLVAGVTCGTENICTDDPARLEEAERLYNDALQFVVSSVAPIEKNPRVVFCASEACFHAFGFTRSSANTVGVFGMVVGPRAWNQTYLRHEMIHHLQAERMGVYGQWRSPEWFKEGMAYSLSNDPRKNLAEPFQHYRARFEEWYRGVGKERLWEEDKKR
ncbi:hypothetical protein ACUUL3_00315 [Thiovibrio sp. JS02]